MFEIVGIQWAVALLAIGGTIALLRSKIKYKWYGLAAMFLIFVAGVVRFSPPSPVQPPYMSLGTQVEIPPRAEIPRPFEERMEERHQKLLEQSEDIRKHQLEQSK